MKNEPNKQDFLKIINKICNAKSFTESDGSITLAQIEAIEVHGGFLSLIPKDEPLWKNIDIDPKSNHEQMAFSLLDLIRDFNLSVHGYRFATLKLSSKGKQAVKKDLTLAKKYLQSIKDSPSKELITLVRQNIQDYEDFLKHEWGQNNEINYKDFPTIPPYKEEYQATTKSNKKAIKNWLNQLVKDYNIKGYSKEIKKLVDKL